MLRAIGRFLAAWGGLLLLVFAAIAAVVYWVRQQAEEEGGKGKGKSEGGDAEREGGPAWGDLSETGPRRSKAEEDARQAWLDYWKARGV